MFDTNVCLLNFWIICFNYLSVLNFIMQFCIMQLMLVSPSKSICIVHSDEESQCAAISRPQINVFLDVA